MKRTLTAFAIAAVFTACTSKPTTGTDTANSVSIADTMSIDHNSFTDKTKEFNMNGVSDTIVSADGSRYVKVDPNGTATKTVTNGKAHIAAAPITKTTRTTTNKTTASSGSAGTSTSSTGTGSETSTGTVSSTGTESSTPPVAKKKGWSNTLKGAVIGGGTGAVAGALIDKNKVRGAIIGGLAGAGGGFIVGKVLDKKAEKNQ